MVVGALSNDRCVVSVLFGGIVMASTMYVGMGMQQ